ALNDAPPMKRTRMRDEQAYKFDPTRASEILDSCRAHIADLTTVAALTSEALGEWFEYEPHEVHLGKCLAMVRQLLDQALMALPALGIISQGNDPQTLTMELACGCENQRMLILGARHITLATIFILRSSGLDQLSENRDVSQSLDDLEDGIRTVLGTF